MKVGDLARVRNIDDSTYGNVRVGEYLIYVGKGSWYGWGRFLFPDGGTGQIAYADLEVI